MPSSASQHCLSFTHRTRAQLSPRPRTRPLRAARTSNTYMFGHMAVVGFLDPLGKGGNTEQYPDIIITPRPSDLIPPARKGLPYGSISGGEDEDGGRTAFERLRHQLARASACSASALASRTRGRCTTVRARAERRGRRAPVPVAMLWLQYIHGCAAGRLRARLLGATPRRPTGRAEPRRGGRFAPQTRLSPGSTWTAARRR
jgi:hypothetical protein